ncbi:MAG: hypothetical protein JNK94_00295 [Hyphomonadaceae bacterium]|nr:hypothetical protein [Hyphomonadaceae bacterium]MBX3511232.1 hypothetical protein [Hyphomonadaceae bacterium]
MLGANIVGLITPTSAVLMGSLAIGRAPLERWLRFVLPLMALLVLACGAVLAFAAGG